MDTFTEFLTPGIIFILTLVFGIWLSLTGKPYNGILFNAHKLIALGTVILIAMQVFNVLKSTEIQTLLILLIILAVLSVIALFASGAFMSIGNLNYQVMLTIHRAALALGIIAMTVAIYLLKGRAL